MHKKTAIKIAKKIVFEDKLTQCSSDDSSYVYYFAEVTVNYWEGKMWKISWNPLEKDTRVKWPINYKPTTCNRICNS